MARSASSRKGVTPFLSDSSVMSSCKLLVQTAETRFHTVELTENASNIFKPLQHICNADPPALEASDNSAVHKRAVRRTSMKACDLLKPHTHTQCSRQCVHAGLRLPILLLRFSISYLYNGKTKAIYNICGLQCNIHLYRSTSHILLGALSCLRT